MKTPAQLLGLYSGDAVTFPLAPRYECSEIEGLDAFLDELARIAVEEDLPALKAVISDDLEYYIQGDQFDWGKAEFLEVLASGGPDHKFTVLRRILPLGCAAEPDDTFVIPWFVARHTPPKSRYGSALVIGRDVPMFRPLNSDRSVPQPRSASWEWAELTAGGYSRFEILQPVRLADGTQGLIDPERMHTTGHDRLIIARRNGRYMITGWVNIL